MKERLMICGAILCISLLVNHGTTHHLYRASQSDEQKVETYLKSGNIDLHKDEILTETEEKIEVGEAHGHKYIKKTKVISTIVYFGGKLEKRFYGESEEAFCQRVFVQRYDEDEETFISRVFNKYDDETVAGYIRRIETFRRLNPHCRAWNNVKYLELTKTYYALTLVKFDFETVEEYYDRILRKRSYETIESYTKRIEITRALLPELTIWKSFTVDFTSERGYVCPYTSAVTVTKRSVLPQRLIAETEEVYCTRTFTKLVTETTETYYSRVFAFYEDETAMDYILRLETIRQLYPELPVWNDVTYLYITRPYFRIEYTRLDIETEQEYYERVLTIRNGESLGAYEKRITILHEVCPELEAWKAFVFDVTSKTGYSLSTTTVASFSSTKETQSKKRSLTNDKTTTSGTTVVRVNKPVVESVVTKTDYDSSTVVVKPATKTKIVEETDRKTVEKRSLGGSSLVETVDTETKVVKVNQPIVRSVVTTTDYDKSTVLVKPARKTEIVEEIDTKTVQKRSHGGLATVKTVDTETKVVKVNQPVVKSVVTTTDYDKSTVLVKPATKTEIVEEIDTKTVEKHRHGPSTIKTVDTETKVVKVNQPVVKSVVTTTDYDKSTVQVKPVTQKNIVEEIDSKTVEKRSLGPSATKTEIVEEIDTKTVEKRSLGPSTVKTVDTETKVVKVKQPVVKSVVTTTDYDKSTVLVKPATKTNIVEEIDTKTVEKRSLGPSTVKTVDTETKVVKVNQPVVKSIVTTTDYDKSTVLVKPTTKTEIVEEIDTKTVEKRSLGPSTIRTVDTETKVVKVNQPVVKSVVTTTDYDKSTVLIKPATKTEIVEEIDTKTVEKRSLGPSTVKTVDTETKVVKVNQPVVKSVVTTSDYDKSTVLVKPARKSEILEKKDTKTAVKRSLGPSLVETVDTETKVVKVNQPVVKSVVTTTDYDTSTVVVNPSVPRPTTMDKQTKIVKRDLDDDKVVKTAKEETIRKAYQQQINEIEDDYFRRICQVNTGEDDATYLERVTIILKSYSHLKLWYDESYLKYTERFYTLYYSQHAGETTDIYYQRLLKREIWETDEEYVYKMLIVRRLFSSLSVWYSPECIVYTESFYTLYYSQQSYETVEQYCERLFAQLPYEDDTLYINRILLIRNIFPHLPAWYDVKYVTYCERFYKLYYSRGTDEAIDVYYGRLVRRELWESDAEYVFKLSIVRSMFPSLPVWYSPEHIVYTEPFYTLYYSQQSYETVEQYCERLFAQLPYEDDTLYINRILVIRNIFPHLPAWYDVKYVTYCERFYKLYYSRGTDEAIDVYYGRLVRRELWESDVEYVFKLSIVRSLFPSLPVWYSPEHIVYTEPFYTLYYSQQPRETVEQYYERLFAQLPYEDDNLYFKRILMIRNIFTELSAWYDVRYLTYTLHYFRIGYGRVSGETTEDYYTRLTKRSIDETDDSYIERVTLVRSIYRELSLWYEWRYAVFTREYYTLSYCQKSGETIDEYYQRLFTRESDETDYQYATRIHIIYLIYTDLSVWYNPEYLLYTREYYLIALAQKYEEGESEYYDRLLKRFNNENDSVYFRRIQFIENIYPGLKVWLNKKFLTYTEDYYRILFRKKSTEGVKTWRARLLALNEVYTPKMYARSLKIIKALFPNFASKMSKSHKEKVYRKRFDNAIKLVKDLRKRGSSSSSSSISKYRVGTSSSSSSES